MPSTPHSLSWRLILPLAIVLAIVALETPLAAQTDTAQPPPASDITLELNPGERPPLRLAFPTVARPNGLSAAAARAVDEFETTLRRDVASTRIFSIAGPDRLIGATLTGVRGHDFEQYRALGNEIVLEASAHEKDGRLVVEGRIFDLAGGDQIVGKRYGGTWDLAPRIAHSFSDEVVLFFTGRRGIALTSIAFHSERDGIREIKEIFLMDYDGRNPRRTTGHRSTSLSPEWNPDSSALAYVSYFSGSPGIYFVDLASGRKTPMIIDGTYNGSPSFSADGRRFAFSRSLGGNTEIFTARRDGSDLRRVTHSPGIDTNPAWSPNGRQIAFTSSRSGSPQIYLMDVDGANLRRITFNGNYNDGAAWHPSGDRLAYATRREGHFQIATIEIVTLEDRLLPAGGGSNEVPTYSPDGRRIAFASDRTGTSQIWVMDIDGSHLTQLTKTGGNWSPDWSGYPK